MANLDKGVTVIDLDETVSFNVEYILANSQMHNVVIINTHALFLRHEEINRIVSIADYFKMFYGCDEKGYKEVVETFKTIAGEIFYIGKRLVISEAVICYWKNKGFQQFSSTLILGRHGLETA